MSDETPRPEGERPRVRETLDRLRERAYTHGGEEAVRRLETINRQSAERAERERRGR